jgi:hypothetical protein
MSAKPLERSAFLACLGEAGGQDHRQARPGRDKVADRFFHGMYRNKNIGRVDSPGDLRTGSVARIAQHVAALRIDCEEIALIAISLEASG